MFWTVAKSPKRSLSFLHVFKQFLTATFYRMLQEIHALLEPSAGLLLVAVVLPFRPFVESGSVQKEPEEKFHALEVRFLFVHSHFLFPHSISFFSRWRIRLK